MKNTEITSREIINRCIEFNEPPRIGLDFLTPPIGGKVWTFTDFGHVGYIEDTEFHQSQEGENEWGIVYETFDPTGSNFGQPKGNPLGGGWHLLKSYNWPDFSKPARYAHFGASVNQLHGQGKYVYGNIQPLMMNALSLRGMENWLIDHFASPDELGIILDRFVEINLKIVDEYGKAGFDGVITWDDMGVNDRGFVSPAIFRQIYLPRYKKIIDAIHERGMHFIHHCCGWVREYMDMFVEGGWDVLQLDQPNLMGIDWLAENYGGKLCFWNPVDIQTTMPKGNFDAIEDEAHHQIWAFGRYGGGFMVKAYQQPTAVGITTDAAEMQFQAFNKYANYPIVPYNRDSKS
jgi:hypothetical protein